MRPRRRRGESGETLALLVVWPVLIMAILLMLVHAFIVANARADAELAASQGLRSAWRAAADADFLADPQVLYTGTDPHPDVRAMAEAAKDAVTRAAASEHGWRWWAPDVAEVYSDWCSPRIDPSLPPGERRPDAGEAGWVRVAVSGEVFGPLGALWPNRWDRVFAAAQGPAVLAPPAGQRSTVVPAELPPC